MDHLEHKPKQVEKTRDQPFLSLSMGMIQPEWFYMSHFFDEPAPADQSIQSSVNRKQPSCSKPAIRIHFRPRK